MNCKILQIKIYLIKHTKIIIIKPKFFFNLSHSIKSIKKKKMEQNVINTFNVLLTFIKNIEPFDGRDVSQLPDFIAQVENLMPTIDNLEEGKEIGE